MADQKTEEKQVTAKEIAIGAIKLFNDTGKQIIDKVKAEEAKFVFNNDTENEYGIHVFKAAKKLQNKIDENGYIVELDEYIDMKDVSKESKYIIRITDKNQCYVEFSYFEYRDIMLDYMKSETDYIYDKLLNMSGNEQNNLENIAEDISIYIGYLCHYKELHIKVYNTIGWDVYNDQLIFKYDGIYHMPNIPDNNTITVVNDKSGGDESIIDINSVYLISSRCENTIADSLYSFNSRRYEGTAESKGQTRLDIINNWVNLLSDVMNKSEKASLIIGAACTGLIRQLLPYSKEDNINMNIVGQPACGKSTICHFALSLFGDPQSLEGSFIDTDNAMDIIRVQRPVIPYILDERMLKIEDSSDKVKKQAILMDIFREYEGKVKEKLAGKGKELSGQRTNAPIISTSVEPMLDILLETGRDLGQYRRFIEISLDKNEIFEGNPEVAKNIETEAYTNYGFGVEIMVIHILNMVQNDKDYVTDKYNNNHDNIVEILKETETTENIKGLSSSAKRFSLIITTLDILTEAINSYSKNAGTDVIDSELHDKVLDILVNNIVEKMKRVGASIMVDETIQKNILKFIELHNDLFTKQSAQWDGKGYVGQLSESEDTKSFIIKIPVNRGIEWLIEYGYNLSDEQIKSYVEEVNNNKEKNNKDGACELFNSTLNRKFTTQQFLNGFLGECEHSGGTVKFEKLGRAGKNRTTLNQITVKKDILHVEGLTDSDVEETNK